MRLTEDRFSQSEPFQAGFPLTAGSCCGSQWSLLPNPSIATLSPNPLRLLHEWCVLEFLVYSWFFLGSSTLVPHGILCKALLYRLSHPCGKDMGLKHRKRQKSHQRSPCRTPVREKGCAKLSFAPLFPGEWSASMTGMESKPLLSPLLSRFCSKCFLGVQTSGKQLISCPLWASSTSSSSPSPPSSSTSQKWSTGTPSLLCRGATCVE